MRSSGEILGMTEPLHWLICECSTTSKYWSKYLLGSTWQCSNYCGCVYVIVVMVIEVSICMFTVVYIVMGIIWMCRKNVLMLRFGHHTQTFCVRIWMLYQLGFSSEFEAIYHYHRLLWWWGIILAIATETWNVDLTQVCLPCYSLNHSGLAPTGATALATALQHSNSLEKLKWVTNWACWYQEKWVLKNICRWYLLHSLNIIGFSYKYGWGANNGN